MPSYRKVNMNSALFCPDVIPVSKCNVPLAFSFAALTCPGLHGEFKQPTKKLRGRRAELEEEEERESKRTDVQTYSEGTFKGNDFDSVKNTGAYSGAVKVKSVSTTCLVQNDENDQSNDRDAGQLHDVISCWLNPFI
ncbi:hypothetical protein ABVT39_023147 [Epinephelus coioides]